MKRIFILFIITSMTLYSNELKTQEDFFPIPLVEEPMDQLLLNKTIPGIVFTASTTTIGIGLTIFNAYTLLESNIIEPENKEFQTQIFFTTTSIIFTVISTWFLKIILEG